jgi:hypothetical protein
MSGRGIAFADEDQESREECVDADEASATPGIIARQIRNRLALRLSSTQDGRSEMADLDSTDGWRTRGSLRRPGEQDGGGGDSRSESLSGRRCWVAARFGVGVRM